MTAELARIASAGRCQAQCARGPRVEGADDKRIEAGGIERRLQRSAVGRGADETLAEHWIRLHRERSGAVDAADRLQARSAKRYPPMPITPGAAPVMTSVLLALSRRQP